MKTTDETPIEVQASQWLRQNSLLMQTITPQASPAVYQGAMQNITAEGEELLGDPKLVHPEFRTEISLLTANAAANLALTEEGDVLRNSYLHKCFDLCDQSLDAALQAESSGLVCEAASRCITFLVYCKRSLPEEMRPDLQSRAERYTGTLEQYLDFQAIDRQLGKEKIDQAYALVACLELVDAPNERRQVLEQAARLILEACEAFWRARDMGRVEQIQADLGALQKSLEDVSIPTPQLAFLDEPLPSETRAARATPAPAIRPADTPPARPPARPRVQRVSPWRWVFSIGGMLVSCLSLLIGGVTLYSALGDTNTSTEQLGLLQTQMSISADMTALAPGATAGNVPNAPAPGSTGADQGNSVPSPTSQSPAILPPSPTQALAVSCPGAPPSRLKLNNPAAVGDVGGYTLTIYAKAGYDAEELYYLEEGTQVLIVGGPTCMDKQLWWQISIDQGNTGWAPESSESGEYLLNP